jgi:hypothetical protein
MPYASDVTAQKSFSQAFRQRSPQSRQDMMTLRERGAHI